MKSLLRAAARAAGLGPRARAFITGAPRSGTSAVLAWLETQPGVVASFEPRILVAAHAMVSRIDRFKDLADQRDRHLRALRNMVMDMYGIRPAIPGRVLLDKEPLEPIALPERDYASFMASCFALFPEMRVLFMVRDPVATVWSMRQRLWGYSLASGAPSERSFEECIEIWKETAALASELSGDARVRICRFEDLVSDPERESGEIGRHTSIEITRPFEPRPTKDPGFSTAETETILEATQQERAALGY